MFDFDTTNQYDDNGKLLQVSFTVQNQDFVMASGLEALRLKLINLLKTWIGQWFLNIDYGIAYQLYLGRPNYYGLSPEMQSKILQINGVSSIQFFNVDLINGMLDIRFSVLAGNNLLEINLQQAV